MKIINMACLRYVVNISCFCQLCVVLCYREFSVKIGGSGRRISLFRGRIATIGLKQVENQIKPNKCDFCTLLKMLYFCIENERTLFSIENRPVGFYTECLLSSHVTHDGENSSWVVQGVNVQNVLLISKSSYKRRYQLCLATFEISRYPVTQNEENWFCVVPRRNLKNVLRTLKSW